MRKQLAINNQSGLQMLAEAASSICDKNNPNPFKNNPNPFNNNPNPFNKNYLRIALQDTYPELI